MTTGHVVTALAGEVLEEVEVLAVLDVLAWDVTRHNPRGPGLPIAEWWTWESSTALTAGMELGEARAQLRRRSAESVATAEEVLELGRESLRAARVPLE